MNKEKLKKQLRDMCIAADGLATAMHLFYANVSSDILDDIIAQAERENSQQENYDRWMDMKRTVETLCGPVNLINQDKVSKVEMEDIIHHCGKDADMDDACCQAAYDPNESQPVDTAPMSLHELTGMQVVGAYPKGWKCKDCIFSEMKDSRCEKKVELVGGYFLCLANIQPNEGAF